MKDQDELDEILLKALKKEPEISLPMGFAAIVTRKVFVKAEKFKNAVNTIFYGALSCAAFCCMLFLYKPELSTQIFSILANGKFIIATVIAGFLMIQYLDQKLLKG